MLFADLVAKVEPREKVVPIITGGDLLAEHDDFSQQLATAMAQTRTSLADGAPIHALGERLAELEAEIAASTVFVRLRGIGHNAFRRLLAEHPTDGGPFDPETFPPALIAACSVDPKMTPAEALALGDVLTDGQFEALFDAATEACREVPDGVPFSVLASAVRSSGEL